MVCQGVFSSSVRICNRHFAVNCFIPKTTSLRLRPDAVPTLFTIRQNSFAASSAIENTDQVPLPDKKIVPAVVQDISLLPSVHYDTKCAQQIMMEYHELEGYLRIKSEEPDIKEEENGCEGNENNSHSLINSSMILSDNTDIKPVVDKSFNPETNQTTIKSDPFQDAESVQCQQKSVMEYDELEGCWNIKSEEFHIKEEEDECEGVMTYDDTDIKPFVDKSHNDETNQMTIECVPHQKWSTPRIDHKVIEDREVTPYPCKLCSYEAKLKEDLTQHMLIHQDISKVTPYQCKLCPYKTKRKGVLSKRGRNHENASEVITYQCKLCPYKTKSKGVLSKHVRILHNTSEVATYQCKVYQCKLCSYKTNQKGSLTRHGLVHQNASR
ncbi:hypothetical protein NQ318_015654 [Aromia moschata]|uniref:C2H2-type domain-containing protein n=1 Tax=Aromia moschata TaxID=1265417 RepID=A0AAV8XSK0_9CUCU|nr:hypothetical protein NQ318_015654 [Aromia moschata]